jgi:hypothetical protein
LIADNSRVKSGSLIPLARTLNVNVHRFQETIGGRLYKIEVTDVGTSVVTRWRAQLQRQPGIPAALMPFYGTTPVEAAGQLTNWLTVAHERMAGCIKPA